MVAIYASLLQLSRQLCDLASRDDEDCQHVVDLVTSELSRLKMKYNGEGAAGHTEPEIASEILHDLPTVRSKGCGAAGTSGSQRGRRTQRCGSCGGIGHNRRSCPSRGVNQEVTDSAVAYSLSARDDVHPELGEDINV